VGVADRLVIDEAGQFSLVNAVAVARSAKSLVLLGDPQQLAQPTQAVHALQWARSSSRPGACTSTSPLPSAPTLLPIRPEHEPEAHPRRPDIVGTSATASAGVVS
jgi:hypothetical protein